MKITFHNLGVVKEAEIDQKPLTIFVGPNNTGKTWTAYTIAGVLGSWGFSSYVNAYIQGDIPENYPTLENFTEQVIKTGSGAFDLLQFATDYAKVYFNNLAHFVRNWMAQYMSTELASFENLEVSLDVTKDMPNLLERILNASTRGNVSGTKKEPELTYRKPRGKRELTAYVSSQNYSAEEASSDDQEAQSVPSEVTREVLISGILRLLHRSVYPFVYILPTERTTFIAHPPRLVEVKAEEATVQNEAIPQQKGRVILAPLGSFLTMMQDTYKTEVSDRIERDREAKNNQKIREYISLAGLLEEILGGRVRYSSAALNPVSQEAYTQDVMFQPSKKSKLEISIASSMVKELSPLLFYLRYLAKPNELIIIDEPEMNLHPEAQVKIIEFLALLVNAGLNILITTHSPYIVDHLSNLIKASEVEDKESICNQFFLKRTDAFIPKDKVMVYLFEQGQAKKAIDEEGVIELNSFGHVSDIISDIYFNL